jgi:hypothetical protein
VRIDKPWGHDCTFGIDNLVRWTIYFADFDYFSIRDGHATMAGCSASAVDQCPVLD